MSLPYEVKSLVCLPQLLLFVGTGINKSNNKVKVQSRVVCLTFVMSFGP
jgi:hypothetical protein